MKTAFAWLLSLFFLLNKTLLAQNADLLVRTAAGPYQAMAGAGSARASANAAIAINPAGLAHARGVSFALSANSANYSYSLLRRNSNGTAFDLNWSKTHTPIAHASVAVSPNTRWGIGLGYFRIIDPFVDNNRRAITGSVLFHQATTGGVYALALAAGFKLNARMSIGAALRRNTGTIISKIRGDNHGRETQKYAELESALTGFSLQTSLLYAVPKFRIAARLETPSTLKVKTQRKISAEQDYAAYFPTYTQTDFALPLLLGVGVAYIGNERLTLAIDFETQRFQSSPLQLNLYEFGGRPNWKDANVLRVGAEYFLFKQVKVPLRLGYAYLPQLYASNQATGAQNSITRYEDTTQNIQHLFTAGTTLRFQRFALSLGLEYSSLKWHRDLQTTNTVRDDYREIKYALFSEIAYYWR